MTAFDPNRFGTRWLIFMLLLALPILRMLLQNDYGLFHVEVGAAIVLAAGISAVLAAVTRSLVVLHAATAAVIMLMSLNAVRAEFLPDVRLRWLIGGMSVVLAAALVVLRENFYKVLAVFLVGSFGVDVAAAVFHRTPPQLGPTRTAAVQKHNHVVHIVLDEMMGLAGLPPNCQDCEVARTALEETLRRGNFKIYPYAFSNYSATALSIPSILNADVLTGCSEYFPVERRGMLLEKNAYFDRFKAKHYDLRVYQSDYLLFSAPKYQTVARTYPVHNLRALQSVELSWPDRLRELMIVFFRSDELWRNTWINRAPARFQFKERRVGPLALTGMWPSQILDDIRRATRDTLFFAHLLTPHAPYVYKADGSVLRPEHWIARSRWVRDESTYRRMYSAYAQQVQFLVGQLAAFLDGLRATGQYDSTMIIIHGDHGPRLRLLQPNQEDPASGLDARGCPSVQPYYYQGALLRQNLLSTFGTLFATKPPGAARPEIVDQKGSIMYFLWKPLFPDAIRDSDQALNSAYLFDDGRPRALPLAQLW